VELAGHRLPGVRGQLLARVGRTDEARAELTHAISLCDHDPERTLLQDRLADLG
jgi:predicted RNA polymerase sigma factor